MKKIILLILFLVSTLSYSQKSSPNYSFFKLLIVNENSDILLVNWNGKWELPGLKYNSELSIKNFIGDMTMKMGIDDYENLKLNGIFSFYYEGRKKPTIMNYYSLKYVSGKIIPPPNCTEVKWSSYEDAMISIPYEDMKEIIKYIHEENCSVYGGTVKKYIKKDSQEKKVIFTEPIYKLSDCISKNN